MEDSVKWASAPVEQVHAAIERALPDPEIRRSMLSYFADAIEYSDSQNPGVWYVAFNGDSSHLRLISGWNVTVKIDRHGLSVRTIKSSLDDEIRDKLLPFADSSVRHQSHDTVDYFLIPPERATELIPAIRDANFAAIEESTSKVKRVAKGAFETPGAIDYLEQTLGRTLPRSNANVQSNGKEPSRVRAAMESAYPDPEVRLLLLNTLVDSIELANQGVPGSWTLKFLNNKNIRLTVGPNSSFFLGDQETLELAPVSFSVVSGELSREDAELAEQLKTYTFHRPDGAISITIPVDRLHDLLPRFLPAHHALIEQTRSGKAVGGAETPLTVLEYIERETGRSLPRPLVRARLSDNAQQVKAVIERGLPDPEIRTALLEYLADSLEYAHSCNPNVWVLSFRDAKELRLITGPTRTVTVHGRGLFVTVMDEHLPSGQAEHILEFDERWTHKNLKASHNLQIPADRAIELIPDIRQANFAAIRMSSDIMRRTIYRKSHMPDAVEYLEHALGRSLPRPIYEPSSSRAWKISVGNHPRRLEEAQRLGVIGLDFDKVKFDLTDFPRKSNESFQDALAERGIPHDDIVNRAPVQLWTFLSKVHPGDRIYLYSEQAFHSSGTITGDYQFDAHVDAFAHRRSVNWLMHDEVPLAMLPLTLSYRVRNSWATLEELSEDEADLIDALMAGGEEDTGEGFDGEPVTPWQQTYAQIFPAAGLHYTPWQQAVFFTALQTKGFVILSGISGTGKTKIAQAFAGALPQPGEGRNVEFLTVRPDWRDSKSLIGYHNPITDRYERTPFLNFLLRAVESWERREGLAWFVILDEMNLAHVEHYFAELLSILESGRDADGWTNEAIQLPVSTGESELPASIKLPPNLFLIGTVNLDETTHAFSPKVLDRAFAMEFSDVTFDHYAPAATHGAAGLTDRDRHALLNALSGDGSFPRIDRAAIMALLNTDERPRSWLETLNQQLRPHHMHFGFRVFDEIMAFVDLGLKNGLFAELRPGADPLETAFDAAVLMKVLPKFHGSRSRLEGPLTKVLAWCFNPDEPDLGVIKSCLTQHPTPDEIESALRVLDYRFPETARRSSRLLWTTYVDGFAAFG